jgi:ribonuclease HIII
MAIYVTELKRSLAERLRTDLEERGFEFSQPPHTQFCAKRPHLSCTLYTSGKFVVQGGSGQVEEFVQFYLEPELVGVPVVDHDARIGCDEAGKGDFFGPLTIAGVYADGAIVDQLLKLGVNDSKSLRDDRILRLSSQIEKLTATHVIVLMPAKYNELYGRFGNLNHLLAWAHASVIEELHGKTGCGAALVDQFANPSVLQRAVDRKQIDVTLTQRTRAESDPVVAAASIMARAAFVRGIDRLGKEVGTTLPKGANSHIKDVGRRLVAEKGPEILSQVGKMHFKTSGEILS